MAAGSVARMKAAFVRDRLSPEGRINYDIWALELERAELQYRFRRYQPPFYSFLYSAHAEVPNFLINTHQVQDASDMAAYIACEGDAGRARHGHCAKHAVGSPRHRAASVPA
jgi:uncharacterized protein (DUF885 family)